MLKFKDYKNCWDIASKPECYRVGQWAFNFVYDTYPDIANKLRATEFDPFYRDERLTAFWAEVERLYNANRESEKE